MRSRTLSWTNTLTKLGFTRKRGRNRAKVGFARPMRVEGLEDRRMLASGAVGTFERLDSLPGAEDIVTSTDAYAEYINVTPDSDYDPSASYILSISQSVAQAGGAYSQSQALGEVLTPVGVSTPVPQISLAATQSAINPYPDGWAATNFLTGTEATFVYDDPTPAVDKAFYGAIHIVGIGDGSAAIVSHAYIYKNGELVASAAVDRINEQWGSGVFVAGEGQTQIPGQANIYLNFVIPIDGGDVITISGKSSTSSRSTYEGNFGSSITAYGFAFEAANPPEDLPPINGGGGGNGEELQVFHDSSAPADLDGDGDIDCDDTEAWIDVLQDLNADAATVGTIPKPLIVTTEEEIDDGDYSFDDLSLREAIALAGSAAYPGEDTIVFAKWVDEIVLTSQLTVNSNVHIAGPGADKLTISGNDVTRVFQVNTGRVATISGLTITRGLTTSTNDGAGIYNQGDLTLRHVEITDSHSARHGGGVRTTGKLKVYDSTFVGNTAASTGGAIGLEVSGATDALLVERSTFVGNFGVWGGAIRMYRGTATILDSTFSQNQTTNHGSAITLVGAAAATIVNSTIAHNQSAGGGGAVYNSGASYKATLHNTIVVENTDSSGAENNVYGTLSSISSHSLFGNAYAGGLSHGVDGNIILTAQQTAGLAPLGHYGGPTMTYALLEGSPAIDKASTTKATDFGLVVDQRGKTRSVNMPVTDGANGYTDIGAYETGNDYEMVVTTPDDESNSGYDPDDLSLREALEMTDLLAGRATITFADTITDILVGPQLVINKDLTIAGPGADILTLDGNNSDRVFYVEDTVYDAVISGLTITRGYGYGHGGGIYNEGVLTLDAVAVDDNLAYSYGGGIYTTIGNSTSGLTVKNSTISNNYAGTLGGGIYVGGSGSHGVQILNSTISTNTSNYGGSGIYDNSGSAQIVNSTVTLNTSGPTGAGIDTVGGTWLANTIVTANTKGSTQSNLGGNFNSTSHHNFIGYDANLSNGINNGSNNNIVGESGAIDARLSALDYWGGPTKTHKPLLDPDSPVLEAGDVAVAEAFDLVFDQRGFDRFYFGTISIGAVELE